MVFENSHSESESSDDDNLELLREAVDPNFINDKMFRSAGEKGEERDTEPKAAAAAKSQRYLTDDNLHIDDLLIPEEVQKFVSKKLAKIIENSVEFVDIVDNDIGNRRSEAAVEQMKLLDDVILKIDSSEDKTARRFQRKKPEIKRRKLLDDDSYKTETMKVREAVVDLEDIVKEVNHWRPRKRTTVFEYIEKNGRLFEVEQRTEFSEQRRKNNWDERKISR